MADPKHQRKFEEGFKLRVVQPIDNGEIPKEIRDEYDIGGSIPCRWTKAMHESGGTGAKDNRTHEQERIRELERENKRLRMEVHVSRTAALTFARR